MKKIAAPLLLGLTAALSACNGNSTPTESVPATTITGRVTSGTGTGTIRLAGNSELASAPVAADGAFALTLPTAERLAGELVTASDALSKIGCAGKVTSSLPNAKGFGFASLQSTRGGVTAQVFSPYANLKFGSIDLGTKLWLYTDQDTRLSGDLDCTRLVNTSQIRTLKGRIDVSVKAGWNVLQFNGSTGSFFPAYDISGTVGLGDTGATTWMTFEDLIKSKVPF